MVFRTPVLTQLVHVLGYCIINMLWLVDDQENNFWFRLLNPYLLKPNETCQGVYCQKINDHGDYRYLGAGFCMQWLIVCWTVTMVLTTGEKAPWSPSHQVCNFYIYDSGIKFLIKLFLFYHFLAVNCWSFIRRPTIFL